jgi:nicotinate-nucleotide adenylyltransferase
MARLGFFGGSFDPVHWGHLWLAQDAFEKVGLDRLFFIPAAQAPLRSDQARLTGDLRFRLLSEAVSHDARFGVLDWELKRGGTSYTIDTVEQIETAFPGDEIFWIIGGDQVWKLHAWKNIEALIEKVTFIAIQRQDLPLEKPTGLPGLKIIFLPFRRYDISSSEIRERLAKHLPIHFFVPPAVNTLLSDNPDHVTQLRS